MNTNLYKRVTTVAAALSLPVASYAVANNVGYIPPPSCLFGNFGGQGGQDLPFQKADYGQQKYQSANLASEKFDAEESLEKEFRALVNKWNEETFFHSSLTKVFTHPAYQRIMAMGKAGLPLQARHASCGAGTRSCGATWCQ